MDAEMALIGTGHVGRWQRTHKHEQKLQPRSHVTICLKGASSLPSGMRASQGA